ncbi:MAG: hypothetical protein ACNS62_17660 [Candidatus Cyclobacteriaceae bacterium M3_2C_046]
MKTNRKYFRKHPMTRFSLIFGGLTFVASLIAAIIEMISRNRK